MRTNRDDFSKSTIETLKARVAHKCSNTSCRAITAGPSTDPNKSNSIGEAAHISAAAPGGPRYDSSMSAEERKSIKNAIWLCSNCSDKIDKDPEAYPISLLQEWKTEAERLALEELGKHPIAVDIKHEGILNLFEAYERWKFQTEVNLIPDLVLSMREEQIEKLYEVLKKRSSKIIISSQAESESYGFTICALHSNEEFAPKVFVVKNQDAWDILIKTSEAKILIPYSFVPDAIGSAIENGHFVIELCEQQNNQNKSNSIHLPIIRKSQKINCLESMGFSHDQAWEIIKETKGYLHAIIRHRLLKPFESVKPDWIDRYGINILSAILFVNSWDRNNFFDQKIIESLVDEPYTRCEEILFDLKSEKEAPIRLVGNVWQVVSKIYLWEIINLKIPKLQIEKLESIIFNVFTEIDPRFEVAAHDRWSAYDKQLNYSGELRESLSDTMCLMSLFWNNDYGHKHWIKKVFNVNLHVAAWFSYNGQLRALAEASPEYFLEALEQSINSIATTQLELLFEDGGDMGGCFHCNLLWALETISWNREYIVKIVMLLSKLSSIPIASRMSNQPMNTLNTIFLGWVNYTSLTHHEKIQILEHHLCKKYPQITWKLLLSLLPNMHAVTSGISKPKYHDWDESTTNEVYQNEYVDYVHEINRLIESFVNDESSPWLDIFDHIDNFEFETSTKIIDHFISMNKKKFDEPFQLILANKLRDEIHQQRRYTNARWVKPEEFISKIEEAFYFIEPDRLIYKMKYLFDQWYPHTLNPNADNGKHDHDKEAKATELLRRKAVSQILETQEFSELIMLITCVDYPGSIGRILGLIDFKDTSIILEWLASENKSLAICAKSYFDYCYQTSKLNFSDLNMSVLNTHQISEIFLALAFEGTAFEILQKQNEQVQSLYWKSCNYYLLDEKDYDWINWILEQFYKFKYPMKAIDFIAYFLHGRKQQLVDINTELLYKLLIMFVSNENNETLNHHDTEEVILFLQQNHLNIENLKTLEWLYSGLGRVDPVNIEKEIMNNPKFFVELISMIYKPKNSQNEIDDNDKNLTKEQIVNRATTAYNVLEKITCIPGINGNEIDSSILKDWISKAISYFKDVDRESIGNSKIGRLLSYAPVGHDEIWPHEAIREVFEEYCNKEIQSGFQIGKSNQRGVTTRAYDEGGEQEYSLAESYYVNAKKLELIYPETAHILKKMGDDYLHQAKWEDERNDIER